MATELLPVVGNWYKTLTGETFEVVALDIEDGTVEIQYFDGMIEEVDLDVWDEVCLGQVAAPEDWSGSFDMDLEDYGVDLEVGSFDDWSNPLDRFE